MQTLQVRLTKELINKAQELVDKDIYSNKSEVIRNLDKAYSDGIITKNLRDRNKSRISKLQ